MTAAFHSFKEFVDLILGYIELITPIVASLALLAFFWGLAKFIFSASEKTVEDGKNFMIWGVVALFVMVSIFGILRYMNGELGLGTFGVPLLPTN